MKGNLERKKEIRDQNLVARIRREKNWPTERGSTSGYFILIDTKKRPQSDYEEEVITDYCNEFMDEMALPENMKKIITFNNNRNRQHHFSKRYIDNVEIKYVVERGNGRLKKNGAVSTVAGGTVHLHIYLLIHHHSNITVHQESIAALAEPFFMSHLGKKPFVSRPKLVQQNNIEKYMTKGDRFNNGFVWIEKGSVNI